MISILKVQELRGAIWAANTAIEEAEKSSQEHLVETSVKIVMLHIDNLKTLVGSAQLEFERALKEVEENKKRNSVFDDLNFN